MGSFYVEEVVMNLGKAPETCYLTGSRAFDPYPLHPKSRDYDFFSKDTKKMREWLQENDFTILSEGIYAGDPQLVIVYHHDLGVDVQLTDDPVRKLALQKIIKDNLLFFQLGVNVTGSELTNKIIQKSIWRALNEATQWKQ